MSVFDVCAAVSVDGGSSFQWNNSKAYGVRITPVTTWILPAGEYDIQPGATTQAINVPVVSAGSTFQINVKWMVSTAPGIPCATPGGNPKIVVSPAKPSFGLDVVAKKKPAKKKAKPAAKKKTAKPAKKKARVPAKKKKATAKKKKKH